jgi:hypothetical protein
MMRIPLRRQAGLVTKQTLYLVQIYSTLHDSCGKHVPHVMKAEVWNACQTAQSHHATVDVNMIAL